MDDGWMGTWMDAAARSFPLCARAVMGCGGSWGGEAAALLRASPTHRHTEALPGAASRGLQGEEDRGQRPRPPCGAGAGGR